MRIFDCFMYFDEDLLLDVRLNYLDPYVDYFVIVESSFTHSGEKRDLKFDLEKFRKFKHKIVYKVYDEIPNKIEEILDKDDETTKISNFKIKKAGINLNAKISQDISKTIKKLKV